MNQQERKYLLNRIKQIADKKLNEAKSLIVTTPEKRLTPQQRYQALLKGNYSIRNSMVRYGDVYEFKKCGVNYNDYLGNILQFEGEVDEKIDKTKYNSVVSQIQNDYQNICDVVMLGSSNKALEMLKNFENKKYK